MSLQTLRSWLLDERTAVRAVSSTAADNLTALAEVIGMVSVPLIPASLTALSLVFKLTDWPRSAAITIAIIIILALESLGISASKTALRLYRAWQDDLVGKQDFLATLVATAIYALLVFLIIAFGDGLPKELRWIGYTSPFLAITTYIVIGLSTDLQERIERQEVALARKQAIANEVALADLDDYRVRQNLKREMELEAFRAKLLSKQTRQAEQTGPPLTPAEARARARELLEEHPTMTGAELGRKLGQSERTGQNIIKEWERGLL